VSSDNSVLLDLQASILDRKAFRDIADYYELSLAFLDYLDTQEPTKIVSPSSQNYIFYQYDENVQHRITRPLNTNLFITKRDDFKTGFERLFAFLDALKQLQKPVNDISISSYLESKEINKVVYTTQQIIGCISDSLVDSNQARKRVGQLFEKLVSLLLEKVGLISEPRTVNLPIPNYPGYFMPYQLDVVFSRSKALLTAETPFLHPTEIVGSIKTTSKDRIDKIFLDKHMLKQFLKRDIPVVAVFLHDVQRAKKGNSIFGVNSTFKTNHFLGYTVALNKLDGVYYVDPRPEMFSNERLRDQIRDFQQFLAHDLWTLTAS
jgi:hypothetical protein